MRHLVSYIMQRQKILVHKTPPGGGEGVYRQPKVYIFGRISMIRLYMLRSYSGTDLSLNPVLMAFVQRFGTK